MLRWMDKGRVMYLVHKRKASCLPLTCAAAAATDWNIARGCLESHWPYEMPVVSHTGFSCSKTRLIFTHSYK